MNTQQAEWNLLVVEALRDVQYDTTYIGLSVKRRETEEQYEYCFRSRSSVTKLLRRGKRIIEVSVPREERSAIRELSNPNS